MSDLNLTGFLFGNIDEEGKLEDDFLDEVRLDAPPPTHFFNYP